MEKIEVRLQICGTSYYILTDEDKDYTEALGAELNDKMTRILRSRRNLSVTQAAVLAALESLDKQKKAEQSSENLRSQVKDYLEDAAKAKSERDFFKREFERLKGSAADAPPQRW